MPPLSWSRHALQDLARLHAFLKDKDANAARKAVAAIRNGVRLLEHHPQAGPRVEGMEPQFRRWSIEFGDAGYLVLYRHDPDRTVLLAVRHMKEAGY